MPIQTAEQARNVHGRRKFSHPGRRSQALNTSGAGIVHREMMDLQRQPNLSGGDIDRLKHLRRDWNRNRKYTDAGMALSGATTQMEAQDAFMRDTEKFRQLNTPAYRSMYPISGGIMHLGEQGGFLGAILSEIGKMGKDRGLPTMIDDAEEDKQRYITETFGPHLEDIEELDFTDEYEGPWPHERLPLLPVEAGQLPQEERISDTSEDIIETSNLPIDPMPTPNYLDPEYFDWVHRYSDDYLPSGERKDGEITRTIPGHKTSYVDRFAPIEEEIVEEATPPIASFDDSGRESGIASMMKSGLRPYEDVYREFVESSGPSEVMVTYEDFMENYLPRIQESRGVFRAGLNSQGRR